MAPVVGEKVSAGQGAHAAAVSAPAEAPYVPAPQGVAADAPARRATLPAGALWHTVEEAEGEKVPGAHNVQVGAPAALHEPGAHAPQPLPGAGEKRPAAQSPQLGAAPDVPVAHSALSVWG